MKASAFMSTAGGLSEELAAIGAAKSRPSRVITARWKGGKWVEHTLVWDGAKYVEEVA